jgi:hypothetical protein
VKRSAPEIDVPRLPSELDPSQAAADDDHVLLYCLERSRPGVLEVIERTFGSAVDHWLYVADPRERKEDDLAGRATVVRWEFGAFPYRTPYLESDAVLTALGSAVRSLSAATQGAASGWRPQTSRR